MRSPMAESIPPEEVRARIDLAPYGAREALSEGLLDGVLYEDELPARLASEERRASLAEWGRARRFLRAPYRRRARKKVALVSLTGAIVTGKEQEAARAAALRRRGAGGERVRRRGAAGGGEEPQDLGRALLRRFARRRRAGFGSDLARGRAHRREETGGRPYGKRRRLGGLLRLGAGETTSSRAAAR